MTLFKRNKRLLEIDEREYDLEYFEGDNIIKIITFMLSKYNNDYFYSKKIKISDTKYNLISVIDNIYRVTELINTGELTNLEELEKEFDNKKYFIIKYDKYYKIEDIKKECFSNDLVKDYNYIIKILSDIKLEKYEKIETENSIVNTKSLQLKKDIFKNKG